MGTAILTSPDQQPESRRVLRCAHCRLMQFATSNDRCRKCRKLYVETVPILTSPDQQPESRRVLRCAHCRLMQFATSNDRCRKCRKLYVETVPTPAVEESPVAIALRMQKHRSPEAEQYDWGAAIKLLRFAHGWSQKDLAIALDTVRSYVSKVENRQSDPTLRNLMRMAEVLEVSLAEIINIAHVAAEY